MVLERHAATEACSGHDTGSDDRRSEGLPASMNQVSCRQSTDCHVCTAHSIITTLSGGRPDGLYMGNMDIGAALVCTWDKLTGTLIP